MTATAISVKAAAKKVAAAAPKALTIAKATAEAGRIARRIMPGALITVDSRGSWDMGADVQTVVTTVTFPADNPNGPLLFSELSYLGNRHGNMQYTAESVTITRRVK